MYIVQVYAAQKLNAFFPNLVYLRNMKHYASLECVEKWLCLIKENKENSI